MNYADCSTHTLKKKAAIKPKALCKIAVYTIGYFAMLMYGFPSFAQPPALETTWKNGLNFRTKDDSYSLSVGGRVHYDIAFLRPSKTLDTIASASDKLEVRRARLSFEGTLRNLIAYEFEFTFGESIRFADMYVAFLKIPYADKLTVGHFREPFGMEENTSSNAIVFMERSLTSAFGPGRNAGIMLQKNYNEKLFVYAGAFRITDDLGSDLEANNRHSYSARMAIVPVQDSAKNKTLHTAVAFNSFRPNENKYEVNLENPANTGANYTKTGTINDVKRVMQIGTELGYSYNKLTLQAEAIYSITQLDKISDTLINERARSFHGYYTMASYFISGGKRKYDKKGNRFGSIEIDRDENTGSLKGAWEVGLRFANFNLRESAQPIKRISDITAGVNWYINSSSRLMFNYIYSIIQNQYYATALQCRIQFTF